MKKLLSLSIALLLVLGMMTGVFAAADLAMTGVIVSFSDDSVKLNVNDEIISYSFLPDAKIVQREEAVSFADVAKKGLLVTFQAKNNQISYMDVPDTGNALAGTIENISRGSNSAIIDVKEIRTNLSEDSGAEKDKDAVVIGEEEDFGAFVNNTTYNVGAVTVVPGSLKVTVNGKELKLIAADKNFNTAIADDEAQIVTRAGNGGSLITDIKFEKEIGPSSITAEEADKIVQVTYKKKMYKITKVEVSKLPMAEYAVIELNGKPSTLAKVVGRGTEALVVCNAAGEVIYIDAYYSNQAGKLDAIKDNTIYFTVSNGISVVFKDKVEITDYMMVQNISGTPLEVKDMMVGDFIMFTVDPADGYKAVSLTRLFY